MDIYNRTSVTTQTFCHIPPMQPFSSGKTNADCWGWQEINQHFLLCIDATDVVISKSHMWTALGSVNWPGSGRITGKTSQHAKLFSTVEKKWRAAWMSVILGPQKMVYCHLHSYLSTAGLQITVDTYTFSLANTTFPPLWHTIVCLELLAAVTLWSLY